MAETIELALKSILDQIDENYEVLVVDDGSTDNSLQVLEKLAEQYPALRYISLQRDKRRLLGETRNISIREARGKYVLPQFDCDDVYEICIKDFVNVFHQLESFVEHDFYLKGDKLNIGRREFLLEYGPYRNMFKEDRDMWVRLALKNVLIPLLHKRIFTRLPKSKVQLLKRLIFKTWAHLQADYRSKLEFIDPFKRLFSKHSNRAYRVRILRCFYSPFAYITARFMEPLPLPDSMVQGMLKQYWSTKQGTFPALMKRYNSSPDYTRLSENGSVIFGEYESSNRK